MNRLVLGFMAVVVCVLLMGCENDSWRVETELYGDGTYLHLKWLDKGCGKQREFTFSESDLEKLSNYASMLEKCSGRHEVEWKDYVTGKIINKEWMSCNNILPRSEMTQEFNNGFICNRCKKYRQEELTKKMDSLK